MMSTIALHMSTLKQVKKVFILAVSLLMGAFAYAQQHGWYVNLAESPIQTDDYGFQIVLFSEQIDNVFLVMREKVYR